MASDARDERVAAALEAVRSGLVVLHGEDLTPVDVDDAKALVRELELIGRMVGAAQHLVLSGVQRSGVHREEGHHSAKVLVRHVGRLSDAEASRREQVRRALADLPSVEASWIAGRIGACQVQLIARVWANQRVRAALVDQDEAAARLAERLSFRALSMQLRTWERLVDQDGAEQRVRDGHAQRNATMHQDFDGNWSGTWNCGALEGAIRRSIAEAFEKAEYEADWAKARAEHGDDATTAHLPRTDAQRRDDAVGEIYRCAADHHAAQPGGAPILTNLLMDEQTFEDELARLTGAPPAPRDLRLDPDGDPAPTGGPEPRPDPTANDHPVTGPIDSDPGGLEPVDLEPAGSPVRTDFLSRVTNVGPSPLHPAGGQPLAGRDAARPDDGPGPPGDKAGAGEPLGAAEPGDETKPGERGGEPALGYLAAHDARTPNGSPAPPPPRLRRLVAPTSSTIDGRPIPPAQVLGAALCGEVRRAVIGDGSVVIDLGRRQRLFTGPAGAALKLQLTTCAWPGCHVPVTHCQGDHLIPWRSGGSTNPTNGAPLCGTHNRTKEQGYRIVRDQLGDLHVHRPDGTEIT